MKTKLLFICFLVKNGVFFNYLQSLKELHISIFDVWNIYSSAFWIKPVTFEYYNREIFKHLDEQWRSIMIKNQEL